MDSKSDSKVFKSTTPFKRKSFLLFAFMAMLVIGAGFLIYSNIQANRPKDDPSKGTVAFEINDERYYLSDVSPTLTFLIHLSEGNSDQAKDRLIELYKNIKVAKDFGIDFENTSVDSQKKMLRETTFSNEIDQPGFNEWLDLQAKQNYINQYLTKDSQKSDNYKGYSYVFWFGNRLLESDEYTPPGGYNNQKLKDEDRLYAKSKAEEIHRKLKSKEISNEEALNIVNNDPKIGLFYQANSDLSKKYGYVEPSFWESQVAYSNIIEYVRSNPDKGLSEIRTGQANNNAVSGVDNWIDAFYYFVQNDGRIISRQEFDKSIKDLKVTRRGL